MKELSYLIQLSYLKFFFFLRQFIPVNTRRFNVYKMSIRRRTDILMDVQTNSCVYWDVFKWIYRKFVAGCKGVTKINCMLVYQNCSLVNILWIAFVLFQRRLSTLVEMFIFCFCFRCFILLISLLVLVSKAVTQTCSARKMFLKISQTSQENSCARVSFLIKLKTFLIECLWWLLL